MTMRPVTFLLAASSSSRVPRFLVFAPGLGAALNTSMAPMRRSSTTSSAATPLRRRGLRAAARRRWASVAAAAAADAATPRSAAATRNALFLAAAGHGARPGPRPVTGAARATISGELNSERSSVKLASVERQHGVLGIADVEETDKSKTTRFRGLVVAGNIDVSNLAVFGEDFIE